MTKEIKKIIEAKVREIGFYFNSNSVWEKEMISICFSENQSKYFPTWFCVYHSDNQKDGTIGFYIRFSKNNEYLDYLDLDLDCDIHIILY